MAFIIAVRDRVWLDEIVDNMSTSMSNNQQLPLNTWDSTLVTINHSDNVRHTRWCQCTGNCWFRSLQSPASSSVPCCCCYPSQLQLLAPNHLLKLGLTHTMSCVSILFCNIKMTCLNICIQTNCVHWPGDWLVSRLVPIMLILWPIILSYYSPTSTDYSKEICPLFSTRDILFWSEQTLLL